MSLSSRADDGLAADGAVRSWRWRDSGRLLIWLAATAIVIPLVLGSWAPPIYGRAPFKPTRIWASLLRVPHVVAPLGRAEEGPAEGVRRVRLQQSEAFAVVDASDLDQGTFAYIDGAQVLFQSYEPEMVDRTRAMVFSRSPTGRSFFFVCGGDSDCSQLVLIARRERLVWALRITQMPLTNSLIVLFWLGGWAAATWRFRHFGLAHLTAAGRRLSVLRPVTAAADPSSPVAHHGRDRARRFPSGPGVDLVLALGIAMLGTVVADREFVKDFRLAYYQHEFGPAINVALGRGLAPFSEAELARNPGIDDFLRSRADSPGTLDLDADVSRADLNQFQRAERYMMVAVGWTWAVMGISHQALFFPWCATVGLTMAAAFLFARAYVGRMAATATALLFLYGPATLQIAHSPRDFLKAPFVFLFLAFAGRCAARSEERPGLWAIGAGLSLGLGCGFRMDVLLLALLFPLALFLRYRARRDAAGPAVTFAVSLLASGWPIGSALLDGNNAPHVTLLGQVPDFWTQSGGYLGPQRWTALEGYEDLHAVALSQVAAAVRGIPPPAVSTAAYDRLVQSVLRDQAHWAPADLISKVIQSHAALWELPMAPSDAGRWLRVFQRYWRNWAGWIWLLAIAAAFLHRAGRYTFVFFAFLLAVASSWLQLSPRHAFHWLPVALVVQLCALRWGLSAAGRLVRRDRRGWTPAWTVIAIVIAFIAPAVILVMGRAQQSRTRQGLARDLLSGAGAEIAPVRTADSVLKYPTALGPPAPGSSAYAVLAVDWDRCPERSIEIRWGIDIQSDPAGYRLVPDRSGRAGGSYLVHLRAFLREHPSFFYVPAAAEQCVSVRELPPRPDFPILWSIVLSPGWETDDHNLRFADEAPKAAPDYGPALLIPSPSGEELRVSTQDPARHRGSGAASAEPVGTRLEFQQAGAPGMLWSPPLVAAESGRYRFEFEIDGPGEWRASVGDPTRTDRSNGIAIAGSSLAHPVTLLMRPLWLRRRAVLDEWLDSGERTRLYLQSVNEEESISVSRLRVSVATSPRRP